MLTAVRELVVDDSEQGVKNGCEQTGKKNIELQVILS
jgi:hypothetical protein